MFYHVVTCIQFKNKKIKLKQFLKCQRTKVAVRSMQVVFSVKTIIRMKHFPVRCVLWRCNNALYAFLIIKTPNGLDTRKSLRCLVKDVRRKGETAQRVQSAISLCSVSVASFFHGWTWRRNSYLVQDGFSLFGQTKFSPIKLVFTVVNTRCL